jgi:arylsulfatase A-like enzyme
MGSPQPGRKLAIAAAIAIGLVLAGALTAYVLDGSGSRQTARNADVRAKAKRRARVAGKAKGKRGRGNRPRGGRPPNVLLIVWDTVRADRLSLYGHDRPTTPGLEAFAEQARVYDHAISPGTWTVPSHASIFTGLPVSSHGANAAWRWVDHHHLTLAEHLAANGYATYSYSANPYLSDVTNLLQGFEVKRFSWETHKRASARVAREKLIPRDRSTEISPAWKGDSPNVAWDRSTHKEAASLANADLVKWLTERKEKDKPWFAFINLMEAHSPRIPSIEDRRAVIGDEELIRLGLDTDVTLWNEVSAILGKHTYTEREVEAIRAVYDASLLELDRQFTALMQVLDDKGALDRTIVVLTSDHGESLGEHGLWEHRYGVWNTLVHVPLVVRFPAGLRPGREDEPVTTASIYPTILDLAGLPPPRGVRLQRSLTRDNQRFPVYTQLTDPYTSKLGPFRKAYPDVDFSPFLKTYDAMVDDGHKVVHSSAGDHRLYDLVDDPEERENLLRSHPDAEQFLARLERWRTRVPKADPALRTEADTKKGRGNRREAKAMKNMLESLGYIEDDEEDVDDDPMGLP